MCTAGMARPISLDGDGVGTPSKTSDVHWGPPAVLCLQSHPREAFTQAHRARMMHVYPILTLCALTYIAFRVHHTSRKLEKQTQERTKRAMLVTAEEQSTSISIDRGLGKRALGNTAWNTTQQVKRTQASSPLRCLGGLPKFGPRGFPHSFFK